MRSDLFRGWRGCCSLVPYSDRSGNTLQCWPSPPPSPWYAIRLQVYIYDVFWHLQNQILCMMSTLVWSDCDSSHCALVDGMIRVLKSSPVLDLRRLAGRPVLHFAVSLGVLVMLRVSFNHIPEQICLPSCCWRTLNPLTTFLVQIESFAWAGLKFLGFLSSFWGTKPKTTLLKRLKCRCKR
jgi:hypothetical protein